MDEYLKHIVAENGLTTIGVNLFTDPIFASTSTPFTVYVHWDGGCKSGNGRTVAEAAECALAAMCEARADNQEAA